MKKRYKQGVIRSQMRDSRKLGPLSGISLGRKSKKKGLGGGFALKKIQRASINSLRGGFKSNGESSFLSILFLTDPRPSDGVTPPRPPKGGYFRGILGVFRGYFGAYSIHK